MYYSGFADEAGKDIDSQIRATKELGWTNIESRSVDGVNLTDIPQDKFEQVAEKLSAAGIRINCFGSAVANWGKDPRKEEDFQASIAELSRAIPRMKSVGTKMIRGMSFAVPKDTLPDGLEIEREVFRKVAHLVKMCEEGGVLYLHENCLNYGGLSWKHTMKLLDNVKSPNLALVFDTGNPVTSPHGYQSSWEFYRNVKSFVRYVHIKDAVRPGPSEDSAAKPKYVWPGEGDGDVRRIVADLLSGGYDGGFSIEPHMGSVYHVDAGTGPGDGALRTYVEYGRRFMKLVEEIRPSA
jgi:sugar phosphate isomerase/epimerase